MDIVKSATRSIAFSGCLAPLILQYRAKLARARPLTVGGAAPVVATLTARSAGVGGAQVTLLISNTASHTASNFHSSEDPVPSPLISIRSGPDDLFAKIRLFPRNNLVTLIIKPNKPPVVTMTVPPTERRLLAPTLPSARTLQTRTVVSPFCTLPGSLLMGTDSTVLQHQGATWRRRIQIAAKL